jgi:epoxide hydrolase-like predicted phosphatase
MLKAIIFDVGGVLIRTRSRAGRQKWADRLGMDAWDFENFVFNGESGRQAQLGQKTVETHWSGLGQHFGLTRTELAEMRRDFFAGDALDEALIGYVQRLGEAGYRLGLLSNFVDDARPLWTATFPLLHYFEGVIISSEVGLMKPDPRIYHLALASVEARPDEALFVDDFIENVRGAAAVGLQALHFTDPEEAQQRLVKLTGVA